MKERPIILAGWEVRAFLEGRKTQIRRPVKPQPELRDGAWYWSSPRYNNGDGVNYFHTGEEAARRLLLNACPLGQPGELLWAKEAWCKYGSGYIYRADYGQFLSPISDGIGGPWRSPIHMLRSASRLTLEVVDVRVQRVQEISYRDCQAEGVGDTDEYEEAIELCGNVYGCGTGNVGREIFKYLWDASVAKKCYSWESNPWVWKLTVKVVKP